MIRPAFLLLLALSIPEAGLSQSFPTLENRFPSGSLIEAFREGAGAAPPNEGARPINSITVDVIKHFEGWEPSAYNDAVGYCTIGYGHLLALDKCENIQLGPFSDALSKSAGENLLLQDTLTTRALVESFAKVELNNNQFGALVSFVFNIGGSNFKKSTLLKKLNHGDYEGASQEFLRWTFAKGVYFDGLYNRRVCERSLFIGSIKPTVDGNFVRSQCGEGAGIATIVGTPIDIYDGE